ncbi:MAG: M20/M25/M40 family metallo-hydrolase [Candidatus Latescibacterota bacterium]
MIDWDAVRNEVTQHLQALIQIDTTNPPGNETEAARYIEGVLSREGLSPIFVESEPGRGNVLSTLAGGDGEPLMLLGHTDVVAVEPEHWTHPPFSGALIDGYVWGRGALDMKNMVAAELMVFLLLKREGVPLNRDVIFAATADEEAGKGNHGPGWIIDHRPELWRARYILTEGGGHDLYVGDRRFYTCQTGQKGLCRLRLVARGTPGHGSMPHGDSAIIKLSRAVAGLEGAVLPVHVSQSVRHMVREIARHVPEAESETWLALLDEETSSHALAELRIDEELRRELGAMLRNTASLTMLQAGSKINVIPGEATAWIDGRLAPGQSQESFVEELRAFVGDEVEIEVDQFTPPLEADADSPLYATIAEVMQACDDDASLLPYLLPAGTDAKHIIPRRPETQIYGFMPYRQKPGEEEMKLIHGHDERTSVEELLFATQRLYEIVRRFSSSK